MNWISDPDIWASLATLAALEVVLGIDNLVFISVVTARLPAEQRGRAQRIGLLGALFLRVGFLSGVVWLTQLSTPLFWVFDHGVSVRDIILLAGGAFLLVKGTMEIHQTIEPPAEDEGKRGVAASITLVIVQIMLLDIVFSIDSVITAIGMAQELGVMIAAIAIAIAVMMFAAGPVGRFIHRHPSTKMLAFSFLLLVGVALIADGFHFHIPRGYLYFAIGFSVLVEALNIAASRRRRARRTERID